jgi:hypothetical protein
MNTKYTFLLSIVFVGLWSVSCTEMVTDIDLPEVDPKLVVNTWVSPGDTFLRATVTRSYPVGKSHDWNTNPDVPDAIVRISNGSQTVQLVYDNMEMAFKASASGFSLVPGGSCSITATASGYEAVDGSTTIPSQSSLPLEYLGVQQIYDEEWGDDVNRYDFKIRDIPGEENFYRVYMEFSFQDDTAFDDFYYLEPANGYPYLSDVNKDGEDILVSFHDASLMTPYYVRLIVLSTDEAYYRYHKSVYNFSGDDPFAEPVQIYTNINNGLGAIGSYLTYKKLVRLR